jgi:NAD(P)-dependent dehydrogenase (short-subunit alcohol dehydrogenase family)
MKSLEGKRTLVTGAASELGSAIVRAFVESGAMVVATGATDEQIETAIEALGLADSDDVITRALDESDLGSWWDLANLIAAFYDELDVFVHIPLVESADSLSMGIDRMKQYLKNADDANPGEGSVVVVSGTGEPSANHAARELAHEGAKIRVYSVEPDAPTKTVDIILDLVSNKGRPSININRSTS